MNTKKKALFASIGVGSVVLYFLLGTYVFLTEFPMPWEMTSGELFTFSLAGTFCFIVAPAFWGFVSYPNFVRIFSHD